MLTVYIAINARRRTNQFVSNPFIEAISLAIGEPQRGLETEKHHMSSKS